MISFEYLPGQLARNMPPMQREPSAFCLSARLQCAERSGAALDPPRSIAGQAIRDLVLGLNSALGNRWTNPAAQIKTPNDVSRIDFF